MALPRDPWVRDVCAAPGGLGLAVLALLAALVVAPQGASARSLHLAPRTILLDPGHGGRDPGASGFGVVEREVNLAVARALADELARRGHVVILTRTTREGMLGASWRGPNRPRAELEARTALGNAAQADVYLSIHCNYWAGGGRAVGAQVFVDPHANPASVRLGAVLMRHLAECTGTRRKLSRRIDHFVLKKVAVPVVTVEMGFLSDPEEARRLGDAGYQRRLARCLAQGVAAYFAEAPFADPESQGSGTSARHRRSDADAFVPGGAEGVAAPKGGSRTCPGRAG